VTFKDLRKRVSLELTQQQSKLLERLQDRPFWIWNIEEHKQEDIKTNGDCCFNHITGLPQKDSVDKPLYDYEKIIFDSLVTQNKFLKNIDAIIIYCDANKVYTIILACCKSNSIMMY
jgi:hypothetical protein